MNAKELATELLKNPEFDMRFEKTYKDNNDKMD